MRLPHKQVRDALKKLRKMTGEIQSGFAKRVGVSLSLYIALENLQRRLSPNTANLIGAATGCLGEELMRGKLVNREGEPYTEKDYRRHISSDFNEEELRLLWKLLRGQLEAFDVLLEFPKDMRKFCMLETFFNQFLDRAITSLKCEREYDRRLIEMLGPLGKTLVRARKGRAVLKREKKANPQPKMKVLRKLNG